MMGIEMMDSQSKCSVIINTPPITQSQNSEQEQRISIRQNVRANSQPQGGTGKGVKTVNKYRCLYTIYIYIQIHQQHIHIYNLHGDGNLEFIQNPK